MRHAACLQSGVDALWAQRYAWSPTTSAADWPLIESALRVFVAAGVHQAPEVADEFLAVCARQGEDGFWGFGTPGSLAASARLGITLIRANQGIRDPMLTGAITRLLDAVLGQQDPDGRWRDPSGGSDLEATCHALHFLKVARVSGEASCTHKVNQTWTGGMRLLLRQANPDGAWYDPGLKHFFPALPAACIAEHPTVLTANALQYAVIGDLLTENRFQVKGTCLRAVQRLTAWQAAEGSWEGDPILTMTAARALMLASLATCEPSCAEAIARAMSWLSRWDQTLGSILSRFSEGMESFCEWLDTLAKYQAFQSGHLEPLAALWGYRPRGER